MPSTAPLVRRLLLVWLTVWLLQSLTAMGGGLGLTGLLELDARALYAGQWRALLGIPGYAFAHRPFPDFLHLFFNGYLLWVFGPETEVLYRGKRFLALVGASIGVGAAVHLVLAGVVGGAFAIPVIGGSGVVMTVLAVHAAVYPGRILNLILLRCRLLSFFLVLVGLDLLGFLFSLSGHSEGIAVDVHLAGAALGWWWAGGFQRFPLPWHAWMEKRRIALRRRKQRIAHEEEAELDRILAKISREGLPSLNRKERAFLEKRSQGRR